MVKEDISRQAMESSTGQVERLLETNRKQSEIISAQARTIEELRATMLN